MGGTSGQTQLRWIVVAMSVAVSAYLWIIFLTQNSSLGGPVRVYGVPLTYMRNLGPTFPRFYPLALTFDLATAGMVILAVAYTSHRFVAAWSRRALVWLMAVIVGVGILLILRASIVATLGMLVALMSLIVVPLLWVFCLGYCLWDLGRKCVGSHNAASFPCLGALAIGVGAWWCSPHDPFWTSTRSDIPVLLASLHDENAEIRSHALSALHRLGPYDSVTSAAILKAMSDPSERVRSNAISLAPDVGPASVPILIAEFTKHGGCTFELSRLGPVAIDAVPALKNKLPTSESYVKLGICEALWKIEGNTEQTVPALIELLNDDFGPIRRDAATMLGEIGPDARSAIPILKEMVDYVPQTAPGPTGPNSQVPTVRMMTSSEFYPKIKAAAATALQKIEDQ